MNGWVVLAVAFLGGALGATAGCSFMYLLWVKFLRERFANDFVRRTDQVSMNILMGRADNGRQVPLVPVPAAVIPASAPAEEKAPVT
jgi:hypothetical protein